MNEKGFTLIEMLIVLLVISILLIITVPNIVKQQASIQEKGCDAFVKMVQAQVQAYQLDNNKLPTSLDELVTGGYIIQKSCPNGDSLALSSEGEISVAP
ncbi:competence type IV pilus major pilin ComGC [Peribacillus alkalitolerans]|uniref:competence type IV pilus major pilin ComGC n=1 Tax=Peribacillus alkalitolerans TaxID=1550385 RepID=UPI0013D890B2|nr:competence type IV pilus major pilin ComGC [Peribacillus alkalitolerans]